MLLHLSPKNGAQEDNRARIRFGQKYKRQPISGNCKPTRAFRLPQVRHGYISHHSVLALDRADHPPRCSAGADHVLVSDGEEVALLNRQLLRLLGDSLHVVHHLIETARTKEAEIAKPRTARGGRQEREARCTSGVECGVQQRRRVSSLCGAWRVRLISRICIPGKSTNFSPSVPFKKQGPKHTKERQKPACMQSRNAFDFASARFHTWQTPRCTWTSRDKGRDGATGGGRRRGRAARQPDTL